MLTAVALCAAGCGGINAGGTVSPLMFLMKAGPPAATGVPMLAPEPSEQFAQAR